MANVPPGCTLSPFGEVIDQTEPEVDLASDRNRKQGDYALDLLQRAIEEAGEQVPGEAANVRGVPLTLWRRYCDTHNLSVADNDESRERAFRRSVQKLRDAGRIRTKAKQVWIIQ